MSEINYIYENGIIRAKVAANFVVELDVDHIVGLLNGDYFWTVNISTGHAQLKRIRGEVDVPVAIWKKKIIAERVE